MKKCHFSLFQRQIFILKLCSCCEPQDAVAAGKKIACCHEKGFSNEKPEWSNKSGNTFILKAGITKIILYSKCNK